jgi:hypothetical protein
MHSMFSELTQISEMNKKRVQKLEEKLLRRQPLVDEVKGETDTDSLRVDLSPCNVTPSYSFRVDSKFKNEPLSSSKSQNHMIEQAKAREGNYQCC